MNVRTAPRDRRTKRKTGFAMTDRAFLEMLEEHRNDFYRFVQRTVEDETTIDDVFAAAVVTAYERRHECTHRRRFRPWMYRILCTNCVAANRAREVRQKLSETIGREPTATVPAQSPMSFYDLEEVFEHCGDEVYGAFQRLTFSQRACLLLRCVEQLSYREIAEVLETTVVEVTHLLAQGRRKVRMEVAEYARQRRLIAAV